ncbi:MAG: hypothetical protein GC154_12885 [bacterium]|nr:hypothetical protein [bacterium]
MSEWRVYGCGSASSSYFLQSSYEFTDGATRLHVDFGNGALYQRCRADGDIFAALDGIEHLFITHSHADHTVDLTRLVVAWKYTPNYSPGKQIHLYGTQQTLGAVEDMVEHAAFPGIFSEVFTLHELKTGETVEIGTLKVRPFNVVHMQGATGVHVTGRDGVQAAFTADTAPFESLSSEVNETDLLVAEASFVDMDHPMHLTIAQASDLAEQVSAKAMLMVHAYPDVEGSPRDEIHERVSKWFSGECFSAYDGIVLRKDAGQSAWSESKMF